MPPIATDVAWSVCVSVCLSVGRTSEPYKNGRPDQDAVWIVDLGGTRNHALGGTGSPKRGSAAGCSPLKCIRL